MRYLALLAVVLVGVVGSGCVLVVAKDQGAVVVGASDPGAAAVASVLGAEDSEE